MPGPNDRNARDKNRNRRADQARAAITKLTDNSGGTPADTIPAVPAAYDQATFQVIVASLTARLNSLLNP